MRQVSQRQYLFVWCTPLVVLAVMALLSGCMGRLPRAAEAQSVVGGDAQRGREAARLYGCGSCHVIPGVVGANALVGPPLNSWADRRYIAGKLPNQPTFLIQWIRFPEAIEPGTAMPNMDVTEQDARDISAYLYTLQRD